MHVLVATAGALGPDSVVEFARHLIGGTGSVTVITVVEVPHGFLEDLTTGDWHPLHDAPSEKDAIAAQYLDERGRRLTNPIRHALDQARIPCEVRVVEGNDPAQAISVAADELGADVVLLGATKQIFDRDAWESVSARVMLESGRPVLVVPEARRHVTTVEQLDEVERAGEPTAMASMSDLDG
jgi:nucleotide-binding universal stress UspA family protein